MDDLSRSQSCPSGQYKLSTKDEICRACASHNYATLVKFAAVLNIDPNQSKEDLCDAIGERIYQLRREKDKQKQPQKDKEEQIPSPFGIMLPYNLKIEMISKMPASALLSLCQTDSYFRNLCNTRDFWVKLWSFRFPNVRHNFSDSETTDYLRRHFLSYDPEMRKTAKIIFNPSQKVVLNWKNPLSDPNFGITKMELDRLLPGDVVVSQFVGHLFEKIYWYVDVNTSNKTILVPFRRVLPLAAFEKVIILKEIYPQKNPFHYWSPKLEEVFAPTAPEKRSSLEPLLRYEKINDFASIVKDGRNTNKLELRPCSLNNFTLFDLYSYDSRNPMYDYVRYIEKHFINDLPSIDKAHIFFDINIFETSALYLMPLIKPVSIFNL